MIDHLKMEITQFDRDKLRAAQRSLKPTVVIGNITEHRTQDPKRYKQLSTTGDKQIASEPNMMSKPIYRSKYLDCSTTLDVIEEDLELGLPIDSDQINANSWLNMNQVEFDKLEWMSVKGEKAYKERLRNTTLFDNDGRAITVDKINGSIEGHDIESLLNLFDSTYSPQVSYALITISRIANRATLGYYDGAFDPNIHDILIEKFLLRARCHLDSPNESVRLNALKCIRSLLCNTQLDELVIDRIHPLLSDCPYSNLWLQSRKTEDNELIKELKDHEYIVIDTVRALLERTDILTKFYYLLDVNTGKSSLIYNECILDIMIRMARHSPSVCCILSRRDLLTKIVELFLPATITSKNIAIRPLSVKALKLIRIIAQGMRDIINDSSVDINKRILAKIPDQIVPVIEAYFFIDCYNLPSNQADSLFKLHIETLRLIKALSMLDTFRGHMSSVIAMGQDKLFASLSSLERLNPTKQSGSAISFDWQYAAHLIDLIGFSAEDDKYQISETFRQNIWCKYVGPISLRWIADIIRTKTVPHLDVSIAISTAVNHYKNNVDERGKKALSEVLIQPFVEATKGSDSLNEMNLFKLLARSATDKSQLSNLLKESGKLRDPKGLPSFGSLNYNTDNEYKFKLNPVFDNESPFILLNMFMNNLKSEKSGTMETLSVFVESLYLNRYIRCITGYHKKELEYESLVHRSIMAQFEVQTIGRSILLLGQYYLNYNEKEVMDLISHKNVKEPVELSEKRVECYNNLVYYAISVIGLLNSTTQSEINLTDQLFESVLLNSSLHTRIANESFRKGSDLACRKYDQRNLAEGGHFDKYMTDERLHALEPLYLTFKQLDRFWIFQPVIDFYMNVIKVDASVQQKKSGTWFDDSTEWRTMTCELNSLKDDAAIISLILSFNHSMIYCSPAYEHLIVRPDLEDHICIVGSLFLDDNLFLDERVSKSITINLKALLTGTKETGVSHIHSIDGLFKDASRTIRPLNLPLADFFDKLINQFESVSYGDIAFSNFLLLFITPNSDKVFKRKLFQERETCLRMLRLGMSSVWLPTYLFFEVKEEDPGIRALIKRSQHIVEGSFLDEYRRFQT